MVALQLDPSKYNCDGPRGPTWSYHWFLVSADQVFIDLEMDFVDAGDYDGDGKSEVLFWHNGYNEDGYSLYFDDFTRRVDFWWHYH